MSRAVKKTERTKFSRKQDQERQGRTRIPDEIDEPIDLKAIKSASDVIVEDLLDQMPSEYYEPDDLEHDWSDESFTVDDEDDSYPVDLDDVDGQ